MISSKMLVYWPLYFFLDLLWILLSVGDRVDGALARTSNLVGCCDTVDGLVGCVESELTAMTFVASN